MRILHYMLGTPPVRVGGLVKYAHDLMVAQQSKGEKIFLLVPGSLNRRKRDRTHIMQIENWESGIQQYQITNALPIAVANGIRDIEWYTNMGNYDVYKNFFQKVIPDIIHVHSLMGIHANFFVAAHDLKIPIVFTTHDFFGVCPKAQFVDLEGNCERTEWNECWRCCQSAFSSMQLVMEQSRWYRSYRNNQYLMKMVQILRKNFHHYVNSEVNFKSVEHNIYNNYAEEYEKLKRYYRLIFKKIDFFHYNSSIAKTQYEKCMPFVKEKGKVISITNAEIKDNREKREFGKTLRIGYLGGTDKNKGYYFLQDVMQQVIRTGRKNIVVHIYTQEKRKWPDWMCCHEPYSYSELSKVMKNFDLVVVPSLLKETFGFVALEAWSYGIPVILTETVGARDILNERDWGYCVAANQNDWISIIERIYDNRELLHRINNNICADSFEFLLENHLKDVKNIYMKVIS